MPGSRYGVRGTLLVALRKRQQPAAVRRGRLLLATGPGPVAAVLLRRQPGMAGKSARPDQSQYLGPAYFPVPNYGRAQRGWQPGSHFYLLTEL